MFALELRGLQGRLRGDVRLQQPELDGALGVDDAAFDGRGGARPALLRDQLRELPLAAGELAAHRADLHLERDHARRDQRLAAQRLVLLVVRLDRLLVGPGVEREELVLERERHQREQQHRRQRLQQPARSSSRCSEKVIRTSAGFSAILAAPSG